MVMGRENDFEKRKRRFIIGSLEDANYETLERKVPRRFYRAKVLRRSYRATALTSILITIFATATIVNAYFAYKELPAVKKAFAVVSEWLTPDYSQKTAQVLVSRGNALRVKKQYAESEHAYKIAIERFILDENNQGLGNVYTELGILHTKTKRYKSAKSEFHKAISYFGRAGSWDGRGYAYINLAQLHLVQRQFKSAKKHFLLAKENYQASGKQEGLGNVALGLGNLYIVKKDYLSAKKHFTEAESVFQLIGNKRGLVNVYNSLGHAFQVLRTKRGRKEAVQYRQLAKSIELNTHTTTLPKFSIQESFAWLVSAFDQHQDIYENEQDLKAKRETEMVKR